MNRKRSLWLLALLPVLGLIWAMSNAASWRPQLFAVQPDPNYRNFSVLTFSPDGKLFAITNSDDVQMWDIATQRILWKSEGAWPIFSPDSQTVALGHPTSVIGAEMRTFGGERFELHDARNGRLLHTFIDSKAKRKQDWGGDLSDCAFSPDGREFRVVSLLRLWRFDVRSGRLIQSRQWPLTHPDNVSRLGGVTFVANGNIIAWGEWYEADGCKPKCEYTAFFDPRTAHEIRRYPHPFSGGYMRLAPDNLTFVEGYQGGNNVLFRLRDGQKMAVFPGTDPKFSKDGSRIYVATQHGCLILDAHTGRRLDTLLGPTNDNFTPSPDNSWLCETRDGKIYRWRAC